MYCDSHSESIHLLLPMHELRLRAGLLDEVAYTAEESAGEPCIILRPGLATDPGHEQLISPSVATDSDVK